MFTEDACCTLVPYFAVHEGKLDAFNALVTKFIDRTRSEDGCLFYAFSFDGDTAHCREGYANAQAVLDHVENVGDIIDEALTVSELIRVEIHGPAAEIDKLREPLGSLNPQFFELVPGGIRR